MIMQDIMLTVLEESLHCIELLGLYTVLSLLPPHPQMQRRVLSFKERQMQHQQMARQSLNLANRHHLRHSSNLLHLK